MSEASIQRALSGYAVASLVLSIVFLGGLASILAVIFGHLALSDIKRSDGSLTGRGLAIAGLILGYIGIAALLVVTAALLLGNQISTKFEEVPAP